MNFNDWYISLVRCFRLYSSLNWKEAVYTCFETKITTLLTISILQKENKIQNSKHLDCTTRLLIVHITSPSPSPSSSLSSESRYEAFVDFIFCFYHTLLPFPSYHPCCMMRFNFDIWNIGNVGVRSDDTDDFDFLYSILV